MNESSKSMIRRLHDSRFATRYFVGHGIDVGAGPDSLERHREFLPLMKSCRAWDLPDGDAQYLSTVADASMDFVHSSHCLEHMVDPPTAFVNWFRVLRPRGHMVVTVPDEDLYEQGQWPSAYNGDHKWTFTIDKHTTWSPRSINVTDLLRSQPGARILKIELIDQSYRYTDPPYDQTGSIAECAIEFVVQKI